MGTEWYLSVCLSMYLYLQNCLNHVQKNHIKVALTSEDLTLI